LFNYQLFFSFVVICYPAQLTEGNGFSAAFPQCAIVLSAENSCMKLILFFTHGIGEFAMVYYEVLTVTVAVEC